MEEYCAIQNLGYRSALSDEWVCIKADKSLSVVHNSQRARDLYEFY